MNWKKQYIGALITGLNPTGDVLEVGFHQGFAAEQIQSFHPKSHTIIESDPVIAQEAKKWAAGKPQVTIIQKTWQEALPSLGLFDAIFFDDSPIESQTELLYYLNADESKIFSEKAQEARKAVEKELSKVAVQFSDAQIEEFYKKVGQFQKNELPQFLKGLLTRGNITQEQYKQASQKYLETASQTVAELSSMLLFLQACIAKHMRKGSRFSCYSEDPTSKYQDARFFELVITNLELEYQEKHIPLDVPNFRTIEPLLLLVEKVAGTL